MLKALLKKEDASELEKKLNAGEIKCSFAVRGFYYFKKEEKAYLFADAAYEQLAEFLGNMKIKAKIEEAKRYKI